MQCPICQDKRQFATETLRTHLEGFHKLHADIARDFTKFPDKTPPDMPDILSYENTGIPRC